ncbi:hypothetical protein [Microbacterium sp. MPKO10]|uniref:hypothetical protein n=1 Tax=Microbacterium sp. MPKO10 TaxID=2989818 RepID=UPI0022368115|nr:hypothetical protein [Microbacterium sp. MPKO10]MCW4458169.1 hypothetical protein [Microbacterium sp. MPKO10]
MSTNDELIAAVKEHLAHNVWDDEIFVLADQLVTALEQVTAERDELLSAEEMAAEDRGKLIEDLRASKKERNSLSRLREQMSFRLRYVEGKLREAEAERDALAAVVEQVRDTLEHYDRQKADVAPIDILDMLPAPSVALDRVKAEALREAARRFRFYKDYGYRAVVMLATENFLNERADRIEKGEGNDQ